MSPEVKIWEARRQKLSEVEPNVIHVKIDGEVYRAKGRINRKNGDCHASLAHVITGKHYLAGYVELLIAIQKNKVQSMNELEVLAWAGVQG